MTNIAKILENAPQGLKLYSLVHGEVTLKGVNIEDEDNYPIEIIDNIRDDFETLTKDGKIYLENDDAECILFPSKKHRAWDNWQSVLFQKGDIIKHKSSEYKEEINIQTDIYVYDGYDKSSKEYIGYNMIDKNEDDLAYLTINQYEYATPEEREQFMAELNANGYKWNTDTKQMEKSLQTNTPEYDCLGCVYTGTKEKPFTIDDFKPFDKVLVRDASGVTTWQCELFQYYYNNENKYQCFKSSWWQCIPYNDETKHLLGTTDDCPKKYKTW